MNRVLAVEFAKTRRKQIGLVVAALLAAQILWSMWALGRMDALDLQQGWMYVLYQFPLLNTIMMPVIAAVVASRLSDLEHKGQALRLLRTLAPAGQLFDAKFLCGAAYLLAAALLQVLIIAIAGYTRGFAGDLPVRMCAYYLLFTTAVSLTILALQQGLALLFTNQAVSLSVGLVGAFAGLFSLFFPQGTQKFLLWGYYGVLMFVRLDWDPATRISTFFWSPVDWSGLALLAAQFCLIYAAGRALFARKEL